MKQYLRHTAIESNKAVVQYSYFRFDFDDGDVVAAELMAVAVAMMLVGLVHWFDLGLVIFTISGWWISSKQNL